MLIDVHCSAFLSFQVQVYYYKLLSNLISDTLKFCTVFSLSDRKLDVAACAKRRSEMVGTVIVACRRWWRNDTSLLGEHRCQERRQAEARRRRQEEERKQEAPGRGEFER